MKKLETIQWNNKVTLKMDMSTLPKPYKTVEELNKKWVLYTITTSLGKVYVGITNDYGQRMQTHVKDARSKYDKLLYADMVKSKLNVAKVVGIYENYAIARAKESAMIEQIGDSYVKEKYGDLHFLFDRDEIKLARLEKLYNINF